MNWSWLSFVIGILVGWLLEWLIDFVFWRRKYRAEQAELGRLQQQLENAQGRQRDLEMQALQCSQDLDACRASLEAGQAELEKTRADLEACQAELDAAEATAHKVDTHDLSAEGEQEAEEAKETPGKVAHAAMQEAEEAAKAAAEATEAAAEDAQAVAKAAQTAIDATRGGAGVEPEPAMQDLTVIEGIGPKTRDLLIEASIVNYAQLAGTPVERLQEILTAAGSRFRLRDPTTWPAQARLAAEKKGDELQALQNRLSGGRAVDASDAG
jgi:predicted flap endonuclease-1-like 5' DNA nuclease